jgi:hypothetical protein
MRHLTLRLRRLLGELSYAQRRTLELRTGVEFTGPRPESRRERRQVAALESTWELPVRRAQPAAMTSSTPSPSSARRPPAPTISAISSGFSAPPA